MTRRPGQKMRIAARLCALLVVSAGAGCAGTAERDRGWLEVRSPNFTIYSVLAEREARKLLENLELFRATILAVTKIRSAQPHVPTEIYVFASERDYRPFAPGQDVVGFFRPTLRANFVALSAGSRGIEARALLYHEYTHFLLRNEGAAHHPLWFEEGFAELLSSIQVRGGHVRIGDPPKHRVSALRYGSSIPYSSVIRARSLEGFGTDDRERFYAQSWLIVHYLMLRGEGDFTAEMRQYIDRTLRRVDAERAFGESFGIEVNDLSGRLQKYSKKLPVFGIPPERLSPERGAAVRVVPPDEIDTRLGWLALNGANTELARQHLERAVAANPNNARAVAGMGEVHKLERHWADAEAAYQRALELAPDDWQNQLEVGEFWLARAHMEGDQRAERFARARKHLARAIELAPEIPEGHAVLGTTYLIEDEPAEPGIEALERAAVLLPAHAAIEYPLARLHLRAGHRERARQLLRRVVHQPHGGAGPQAALLLEELEKTAGEGDAEAPPTRDSPE